MLPVYAYQDNDLERQYLESIKTAMKNGATINRFIIGNKEKFNNLESNELYNYTINNNNAVSSELVLENFEGVYVAMHTNFIRLDLRNTKNKICFNFAQKFESRNRISGKMLFCDCCLL